MDLYELYLTIQGSLEEVSFESGRDWFKRVPHLFDQINKRYSGHSYYRALSSVINSTLPKASRVLDLGTYEGCSAAAMLMGGALVDSIDLLDSVDPYLGGELTFRGVRFCYLPFPESVLTDVDYSRYSFIFVDIDHSGKFEPLIHKTIRRSGYKGLVFYDDIDLNDAMRRFWKNIELPKYETDWHFSGFGMVSYGGDYGH